MMPFSTTLNKFIGYVFFVLLSLCSFACTEQANNTQTKFMPISTSTVKQAAVAMPDSFSAEVAKNILQKGGNAVDAAIAAQFVLAVWRLGSLHGQVAFSGM